jgi:hypothetical protein
MTKRNIAITILIVTGLLATLAAAVPPPDDYDLDRILTAIRQQESGGEKNPNEAVGDNGASLGSFQISRAYWIDALDYDPSIGGEYEDVKNPDYARRVVVAYLSRYIKKSEHWTDERAARLHNGGPNAMRKKSTIKYWREVRARLD